MSSLDPDDFDSYTAYVKAYCQQMEPDWDRPVKPDSDASSADIQWYMDAIDGWHTFRGAEKIREQNEKQDK